MHLKRESNNLNPFEWLNVASVLKKTIFEGCFE